MKRSLRPIAALVAAVALCGVPAEAWAETVHETFLKLGEANVIVEERVQSRPGHLGVTVHTTEGTISIVHGQTVYFEIPKYDKFTRAGGFIWKRGRHTERTTLRGGTYVKAVRNTSTGAIDWYRVSKR